MLFHEYHLTQSVCPRTQIWQEKPLTTKLFTVTCRHVRKRLTHACITYRQQISQSKPSNMTTAPTKVRRSRRTSAGSLRNSDTNLHMITASLQIVTQTSGVWSHESLPILL